MAVYGGASGSLRGAAKGVAGVSMLGGHGGEWSSAGEGEGWFVGGGLG